MSNWVVHSYYIGLGVIGDSAIHLLVENPSNIHPSPVHFALLVDGGDTGGQRPLMATIQRIEQMTTRYNLSLLSSPGHRRLKFSAVVISHWDTDHWWGVLNAMKEDIEAQQKSVPGPVTNREISFFQYDGSTPRLPRTILYAPAHGIPSKIGARLGPAPLNANVVNANLTLGAGNPLNMVVINAVKLRLEPVSPPSRTSLTLVGTNLITGNDLPADLWKTIISPQALVAANPPTIVGQPGIYILAASKRVIGSRSGLGIVEADDRSLKNKSSIACMIMFPSSDTGVAPRLSHYFAGDMHWREEKKIVDWVSATGVRTTPGMSVTTMKVSHHGAKNSTPVEMLASFNPRHIVACVGEHNGHPSWELLFFIEGWKYTKSAEEATVKPFLPTQFPYYLLRMQDAAGVQQWLPLPPNLADQLATDNLTAGTAARYRTAVQNLYNTASAPLRAQGFASLLDPFTSWNLVLKFAPTRNSRDWVREQIAWSWNRISPVPPTAHTGCGAVRVTGGNRIVSDSHRLEYYRLDSIDGNDDGSVRVKYANNANEEIIWPEPDPLLTRRADAPIPRGLNKRTYLQMHSSFWWTHPNEPKPQQQLPNTVQQSAGGVYSVSNGTDPDELFPNNLVDPNGDQPDPETRPVESIPADRLDASSSPSGIQASTDAATDITEPFFFICGSDVETATGPGPSVKVLADTNELDAFITSFHLQGLVLADVPTAGKHTPLHAQDEFQAWIVATLGLGASADKLPSVQVQADPTSGAIQCFTLEMPHMGLTFISTASVYALNIQGNCGLGQAGTIPGQDCLILGLTPTGQRTGLSLTDILLPASIRGSKLVALQLLLLVLGSKLTFDLDTSIGSRNAIWFAPTDQYKTTFRSQYLADQPSLKHMDVWISNFLAGITVKSIKVITKLECSWASIPESIASLSNWEFIITTDVMLQGVDIEPIVTLDFTSDYLVINVQFNYQAAGNENLLAQIMSWISIQKFLKGVPLDFQELFKNLGSSNFEMPLLRRLKLGVGLDKEGMPSGTFNSVMVDLEMGMKFGQPLDPAGEQQKVVFLFTYTWSQGTGSKLRGSLWNPPPPPVGFDHRLLPEWEPHQVFEPASTMDGSTWAPYLDWTNLIPNDPSSKSGTSQKIIHIPDGVPTEVFMVVLEISTSSITFEGAIECDVPKSVHVPKLYLSRLTLKASYDLTSKDFDIVFGFGAAMNPRAHAGIVPIQLIGSLEYDSQNGFSVTADVETPGMQGAHFLEFFDDKTAGAATSLIQHVELLHLHLEYHYEKAADSNNAASHFTFTGALVIGKLELDLTFDYTGKDTWTFDAFLGASSDHCTVQDILDSIAGDGTVDLPSCVGDILIKPNESPNSTPDAKAKDFVHIQVTRLNNKLLSSASDSTTTQTVLFTVSVNVGLVSFTFLQFRESNWDAESTPSKRLLRIEVNELPRVEIPVIGDLTQPFDEMCFMWVQDASGTTNPKGPPGLTMEEVGLLNSQPELADDPIYYMLTKDPKSYGTNDAIVEAGCHFVLVVKNAKGEKEVVLDYVFEKPKPEKPNVPPPAKALEIHAAYQQVHGANAVISSKPARHEINTEYDSDTSNSKQLIQQDSPSTAADAGGGTAKAPLKKSIGPFSISNIGLHFANSTLSVCLDAEVAIGPISMGMLGFSLDLNFGKGFDLKNNFPTPFNKGMTVSLQGLITSFDNPPLTIAGGLLKQQLTGGTFYVGGVDIGFAPWAFLAAGGYGDLQDPKTQQMFKSAFIFAKLNGPLLTLEFASISGVTGGFGYNSALTLPTVEEVPRFPFLAMPEVKPVTGDPTMDTILSLTSGKWFNALNGSFWVGAGLTVSAFEMLDITAVAVVEWDTDIRLGVYAVAVADIPSSSSAFKLAHVELGMLATVDFGKGLAQFEAQLSPASYILDPSCHLSGGFALYYWFKDGSSENSQQRKGDWVFTLGGYHSLYKPPPQCPVPPRLQISWSLGPLSIWGQSFFAITPSVAMAGVEMHASLGIGVLYAFFDAYADFLINFRPFMFQGGGGVDVGVKFVLDFWFITIHISVEIGATLYLTGPPISGTCHVNFWVFGFDINFGSSDRPGSAKLHLQDFYHLVLQQGSPGAQSIGPEPQLFACKTGLLPSSGSKKAAKARMAKERRRHMTERVIELDDNNENAVAPVVVQDDDADNDPTVWAVHAGTFSFTISSVFALSSVTVYPDGKSPQILNAPETTCPIRSRPMNISIDEKAMTSNLKVSIVLETGDPKVIYEPKWELKPIISNAPKALWDAYDPSTDPSTGSSSLLDGQSTPPTIPLMMGITFLPPPPILSQDKIPKFNAILSQLSAVFTIPPPFPDSTTTESPLWRPVPPSPPPPPPPPGGGDDPTKPWENVQKLWKTPDLGAGAGQQAVDAWVRVMGWDPVGSDISGAVPVKTVNKLQNLYVAAPIVAQAAAA